MKGSRESSSTKSYWQSRIYNVYFIYRLECGKKGDFVKKLGGNEAFKLEKNKEKRLRRTMGNRVQ